MRLEYVSFSWLTRMSVVVYDLLEAAGKLLESFSALRKQGL